MFMRVQKRYSEMSNIMQMWCLTGIWEMAFISYDQQIQEIGTGKMECQPRRPLSSLVETKILLSLSKNMIWKWSLL